MRFTLRQPSLWVFGAFSLLLLLTMLFATCDTYPKNTNTTASAEVIKMSKGPCFGSCPVFTLTIYSNAIATYEGERFTDKQGLYTKNIGKEKLRQLVAAFQQADLWRYPDAFKSQIPDLQSVTLTFTDAGKTKSIVGKDGRPEALLKLEEMLDEIANSVDWTLQEAPDFGLPEGFIANELIVQLKPEVNSRQWVQRYAKQEMAIVKQLNPSGNYYLVTFNTSAMAPQEMLNWVKQDPDVLEAEFNKEVRGRR